MRHARYAVVAVVLASQALAAGLVTEQQIHDHAVPAVKLKTDNTAAAGKRVAVAADGKRLTFVDGDSGATGPTGPVGGSGATGPQGPTGAVGGSGATGPQGPTGVQGATGATGPVGATGTAGAVGATGSQGTTGPTGPAGSNGTNGATGATGSVGATGATGSAGATGIQGVSSGSSWTDQGAGSDTDPGPGNVARDNATASLVGHFYFSHTDLGSVDMTTWLTHLADSSSTAPKANLRFGKGTDSGASSAVYTVTSVLDHTGYTTVTVAYSTGGLTSSANYVITTLPKGDKGDTGAQGPTGATGSAGTAGATGATGSAGSAGATGATGPVGATGTAGAGLIAGWILYDATTSIAVAKADPSASTSTLTNWNTTLAALGSEAIVSMDNFTTIRLVWRAADGAAQTGTVTCEIFDSTSSTSLVSQNFSSNTTLTTRSTTAAVSLTGRHELYARVSAGNATDDPVFNYVGFELQ
jgi:hypothetical protein